MRLEYDTTTDTVFCWDGQRVVYSMSYWDYVAVFGTRPEGKRPQKIRMYDTSLEEYRYRTKRRTDGDWE